MAKKKAVLNSQGENFIEVAKKVTEIRPVGNQVLVERLTEAELTGSTLLISGSDKPSNQGYVLAIGPQVSKEYGISVGDRVLLQGSFVPAPETKDDTHRERNLVLPDMIKAILVDE